jgi:hypothetical protein
MALDGVTRAEFRHRDTTISIERSEVPRALSILAGAPGDAPFAREDDGAPEFEYEPSPAGYVSSLMLVGEFENMTGRDGSPEIRFVPRDSTLAHYFVVTRGAEAGSYQEMVDYEVTGNVTLTPEKGATIDVLSIMPPRGALLTRPG